MLTERRFQQREKQSITVDPNLLRWVEENRGKPLLYFTSFSDAVNIVLKELKTRVEKQFNTLQRM